MTSTYPLLQTINDPADLRKLSRQQLHTLSQELRAYLLESVSQTGGHLSSNLGTVELTIALHYVFRTPYDRVVWDVGHQTYPHKILTGRRDTCLPCGSWGAFRVFQGAAKANTTPLVPRTRALLYPLLWAWPWPRGKRVKTAMPLP